MTVEEETGTVLAAVGTTAAAVAVAAVTAAVTAAAGKRARGDAGGRNGR